MDQYKCKRCGNTFSSMSNLIKHLKRKVICPDLCNCEKTNESLLTDIEVDFKNPIECEHCKGLFATKNFKQHLLACKYKNDEHDIFDSDENEDITLKSVYKMMLEIKKELIKPEKKRIPPLDIPENVTDFKKISNQHISSEVRENLLKKRISGVVECIELLYFNTQVPENKTVNLLSIRDNIGYIIVNKQWVLKSLDEIIDSMIFKAYNTLNQIFLNKFFDYDDQEQNDIKKFLDKINTRNSTDTYKTITRRVKVLLIINSKPAPGIWCM